MLNTVDGLSKELASTEAKVELLSTPDNPFVPGVILAASDDLAYESHENPASESPSAKSLADQNLKASQKELFRAPENPYLLNNVGLSLLNSGKVQEAASHFTKALEKNGGFVAAKFNLARAYLALNRLSDALSIYTELEPSTRNSPIVHTNTAEILFRMAAKADAATARTYLTTAKNHLLSIEPPNAATHNGLGLIHTLLGDGRQAVKHFRQALAQEPRSPVYHLNLGGAYFRFKNYNKALVHFRVGLSLDPQNTEAVKNIARCYIALGKFDIAEDILREHRSTNPGENYLSLMAQASFSKGRYKACLSYLLRAADLVTKAGEPPHEIARIYNNIGCTYDALGEDAKAKEYFLKSVNIAPGPDALVNLAIHALLHNDLAETQQRIDFLETSFPSDPRLTYLKGRHSFHLKEYDKSMQYVKQALEQQHNAPEVYALGTHICAEIYGDYPEAIALALQGLRSNPGNIAMKNNLAYYYIMNGELQRGRHLLDQMIGEEASNNAYVNATTGLLYIKEGQLREAERLYGIAFSKLTNKEKRNQARQKYHLELGRYWFTQDKPELAERHLREAIDIDSVFSLYRDQAAKLLAERPERLGR